MENAWTNSLLYKVISWIRFPLIVGVVMIHCMGSPVDVEAIDFHHLTGADIYDLLRILCSNVVTRVCVPLFFFISGYLFFTRLNSWRWQVYGEKLKKRVRTLLVPYLLWITIAVICILAVKVIKEGWGVVPGFLQEHGYWHLYWDCFQLDVDRKSWLGMVVRSTTPFNYALWYLRDLMTMVLLAPAFYVLFRYLQGWGLLLLAINYVSNIGAVVPELLPTPVLFFGAGAYCQIKGLDVCHTCLRYEGISYVLTLPLLVLCTRYNSFYTETGDLFFPFFVISGCVSVLCLSMRMVIRGRLQVMGRLAMYTFFVYLAHTVMIVPVSLRLLGVTGSQGNWLVMSMAYLVAPLVIIAVCIGLYEVLKRCCPQVLGWLTGGR